MAQRTWNWNYSAFSKPAQNVAPATKGALRDIVTKTNQFPSPLRAVGEVHSMNSCFATTGTHVSMEKLSAVGNPVKDEARGIWLVTAQAGATMFDIRQKLRQHNPPLELEVSPEIGNATVGSSACCGTKDASLGTGPGQISSIAERILLMDANGNDVELTLGSEDLRWARCSYGLMGVVQEATFRARPLAPLDYEYHWFPADAALTRAKVFGGADGVLAFLQPYRKRIMVERRTRVADPATAANRIADTRVRREIRDWVWQWGATQSVALAPILAEAFSQNLPSQLVAMLLDSAATAFDHPFLNNPLVRTALNVVRSSLNLGGVTTDQALAAADKLPEPLFELLEGYTAHRSDSMINFTHDRQTYFEFTFWAFPQDDWEKLLPLYLKFCEDFHRDTGFRASLFTEIYFIAKDESSPLSFSLDAPIFTLDMVDHRPWDPRWQQLNERYNEWAAAHGGRPLLNQTKRLEATPGVVAKAFKAAGALGQNWDAFRQRVTEKDPSGRFRNEFFDRLLKESA